MKNFYGVVLLVLLSWQVKAQDTIYMKNGVKIPAIIEGKDQTEIQYRKFESITSGVYSVFISDVSKIQYRNGKTDDFTTSGEKKQEVPSVFQHNAYYMKYTIGMGANYLWRNTGDNLLEFWQYMNSDPSVSLTENRQSYTAIFGMYGPIDGQKRNWFGCNLLLSLTPRKTIYASNQILAPPDIINNEIQLQCFWYNIGIFYGHTLGHKKKTLLLFEPGLDVAAMFGKINWEGTEYNEFSLDDLGFHMATGLDWNLSRRFMLSIRMGERFMTKNEKHDSQTSTTGVGTFYTNASRTDVVKIKWSGFYVSGGISVSLFKEIKNGREN